MHLLQPGIILFTHSFSACVEFYRDRLQLPELFHKPGLVCLRFGPAYLMIEQHSAAASGEAGRKTCAQNTTIVRFNVPDVEHAAQELRGRGVAVEVLTWDWGTIGVFFDPDGNRCELKNHDTLFD